MNIKRVTHIDEKEWNKLAPHPLVSWEWGEARKEMGISVLRLGEYEGKTLKNVFQITFHPIPKMPYTVGYMPRTVIPSQQVLDHIITEAKKKNAIFVKMEPYVLRKDLADPHLSTMYNRLRDNTTQSTHPLFPQWTQLLDLTQSEEDLLSNMKSKWRYNIRLAQRKGVSVEEMTTNEGFELFADLYFETTKRQKYSGHTREYHKIIFDHLREKHGHILVALYQDKPLAAYHLFFMNDVMYYPYGGSSLEHRNLMASNLLMWEAIKFGKKRKAKVFDMWGSMPPDYDRSAGGWAGFSRFKEGFGTEFVEFIGSYDLVLNKLHYRVYNVADIVRKKFFL